MGLVLPADLCLKAVDTRVISRYFSRLPEGERRQLSTKKVVPKDTREHYLEGHCGVLARMLLNFGVGGNLMCIGNGLHTVVSLDRKNTILLDIEGLHHVDDLSAKWRDKWNLGDDAVFEPVLSPYTEDDTAMKEQDMAYLLAMSPIEQTQVMLTALTLEAWVWHTVEFLQGKHLGT